MFFYSPITLFQTGQTNTQQLSFNNEDYPGFNGFDYIDSPNYSV